MTKAPNTQSEKRQRESLGARFGTADGKRLVFLKSSSDLGVIRNGGRNGARFAPRSLLSFFKKLALDEGASRFSFEEVEVASALEEAMDFTQAQELEAKRLGEAIRSDSSARIIHLGGGHDHIYPLLKFFSNKKRVIVLNLDAHADTRTDDEAHSGTPFRQFAREFTGDFHLFQLGLHAFSNAKSTLSQLPRGQMHILWQKDLLDQSKWTAFFDEMRRLVEQDTVVIFSLDADAMSGELVPGVSAVNGLGLKANELFQAWDMYRSLPLPHEPMLGIYELNPVFDTLSGISMRFMSSFIYLTLSE